ncbi:FecR protein [Azorhizobium oxalatiphilum]|uniref:FecR protein n=1 Tax=Azorhizobium oxalatiphilum TaxID=980631 RepID=A0A917BQT0_9HYPH|nr:FecR domain-containing protein [Azorhizobium oxalatiphilum]GGF54072.1 FecR protein [Azorhizobium oxalatiphilum]
MTSRSPTFPAAGGSADAAPADARVESARVEKEAVAWFTRMNGRPSSADRQDFANWLAAPAHADAYADVRAFWDQLGPLSADLSSPLPGPETGVLAGPLARIEDIRRKRRMGKAASGIALGLAALLLGGWLWLDHPHLLQDLAADHVAPRGQMRTVALADGSTVLLDADSAIDVTLSLKARRVNLLRGTAFFQVQKGPVPFIVEARNGEARVLGTTFEVAAHESDAEGVTVTLATGSLKVDLTDRTQDVLLKPGESVDYGAAGLGPLRQVDVDEAMAWRTGRYIFTNARLADVLERIGRYRDGRIVLLSSTLADMRVSGNISLRDTDAALAAVRATVGFPMHSLGKVTVIGP